MKAQAQAQAQPHAQKQKQTTIKIASKVKQGYVFTYNPVVNMTSDILKTGHYKLPLANTLTPRNSEPLTLSHKVDHVSHVTKLTTTTPTTTFTTKKSSGNYTGKHYKRPINPGACLTVWEWCDANPHATRKQAIEALSNKVNKTTIGLQYGHWVKDQG